MMGEQYTVGHPGVEPFVRVKDGRRVARCDTDADARMIADALNTAARQEAHVEAAIALADHIDFCDFCTTWTRAAGGSSICREARSALNAYRRTSRATSAEPEGA